MPYKNKKDKREYDKRYRLEHPEQNRRTVKQWRLKYPNKRKDLRVKEKSKRRNLGFIPLNSYKKGYVFHHLDFNYGIYMPEKEHRSIKHSVLRNINMDEINAIAWNYLKI
ncbi:MAG: hypothetical protein GYA51_03125 [Candidatus Methanofastidiosa archaeon]|nr:hypothetical protein [Candidatus Methanofastidiosa archaeon]